MLSLLSGTRSAASLYLSMEISKNRQLFNSVQVCMLLLSFIPCSIQCPLYNTSVLVWVLAGRNHLAHRSDGIDRIYVVSSDSQCQCSGCWCLDVYLSCGCILGVVLHITHLYLRWGLSCNSVRRLHSCNPFHLCCAVCHRFPLSSALYLRNIKERLCRVLCFYTHSLLVLWNMEFH